MSDVLHITLDTPVNLNRLYRVYDNRVLLSEAGRDYKRTAGWQARAAMGELEPLEGVLVVAVKWFRKQKRGDIDAPIKITLDSLNKIVWQDDSQISGLLVFRFEDKLNPRIEIGVRVVEPGSDIDQFFSMMNRG